MQTFSGKGLQGVRQPVAGFVDVLCYIGGNRFD